PLVLGRALTLDNLYSITAQEFSRFFAIIGDTGSGKTTLITSIYHLFLDGKAPAPFLFAGSETLWALEERAFYLRAASYRSDANMERTQRGLEESILHLRLKNQNTKQMLNLLFSDLQGEDFDDVTADVDAAKETFSPLFTAARNIVVLLDGEKLLNSTSRSATTQKAAHLLHTLRDAGLLDERSRIFLTISKYDIILERNDPKLVARIDRIPSIIISQLPDLENRLEFFHLAAMPTVATEEVPVGYNVSALLNALLKTPQPPTVQREAPPMRSQCNLWKGRII
ncbi:MAG: hypothetical protein K2M15_02120, partial [Oscillospiraceae bacterium]|nr:hypothetical protein [Oscillospiraceae bacterium]